MPAFLAGPLLKIGAMLAVVGGLALALYVEHIRLAAAHETIKAQAAQLDLYEDANKALSDSLDRVTADKDKAIAAADAAAHALEDAQARIATRTETVLRTIRENAVAQDRDPVSPALRAAIGELRK